MAPSSIQHLFAFERVLDLLKAFGVIELAYMVGVVVCGGTCACLRGGTGGRAVVSSNR